MSLYAFIALPYKQLLQYTLLKSFTVPSALLTQLPKKFHMKDFIFTKPAPKTLLLWRRRVSFEYQGLLQNTPASFFLSMLKLHCKRHYIYRKLATYSWVQHDVNTSRKRRDADIRSAAAARRSVTIGGSGVSKMSAAAHSSNLAVPYACQKRRIFPRSVLLQMFVLVVYVFLYHLAVLVKGFSVNISRMTYTVSRGAFTLHISWIKAQIQWQPSVWNNLPTDLRKPDLSFSRFRLSLKTFLCGKCDQKHCVPPSIAL